MSCTGGASDLALHDCKKGPFKIKYKTSTDDWSESALLWIHIKPVTTAF